MSLALLIFTVILAHCAYGGTRLNISLAALSAGASPLVVGVMMSLIAALPMVLGVAAGKFIDRSGVRVPMITGVSILITAVALPGLAPGVPTLLFSAAGIGAGFMLFQICAQHMVGEMSSDEDRRDNFGWLALGFATSNFIGPTVAGLAIDRYGHDDTFMIFAGFALASRVTLVVWCSGSRAARAAVRRAAPGADARREAAPRVHHLGLLASSWDLFVFIMPIYGVHRPQCHTIGLILASFAAATFTVRLMLPILAIGEGMDAHHDDVRDRARGVHRVPDGSHGAVRRRSRSFSLGLGATQPTIMALVYSTPPRVAREKQSVCAPWSSTRATPCCRSCSEGSARCWEACCRCSGPCRWHSPRAPGTPTGPAAIPLEAGDPWRTAQCVQVLVLKYYFWPSGEGNADLRVSLPELRPPAGIPAEGERRAAHDVPAVRKALVFQAPQRRRLPVEGKRLVRDRFQGQRIEARGEIRRRLEACGEVRRRLETGGRNEERGEEGRAVMRGRRLRRVLSGR
jgi:MFS family permease